MAEINGIDLAHMPNGAHYLFALDVLNKAKANAKIAERAAAAVGVLEKKVAAEDEALQLSRKSLKTDEIKSLDGTRDSMYSYYRKGVKDERGELHKFTSCEKWESKKAATHIYNKVNECRQVVITKVESSTVNQEPPLLYDLTALQKDCNSKYGFTAEQTLQVVQKLYEAKLITYPRTSSRYVPEDVFETIPSLLGKQKEHEAFGAFISNMGELNKYCVDAAKVTDHHALLITGNNPVGLYKNERIVYDMILGRMVEAFSDKAIVNKTAVTAICGGTEFEIKGSVILQKGWKAVYNDDKKDVALPNWREGMTLMVSGCTLTSGKTKPKPLHTESTLLAAMEGAVKEIEDDKLRQAQGLRHRYASHTSGDYRDTHQAQVCREVGEVARADGKGTCAPFHRERHGHRQRGIDGQVGSAACKNRARRDAAVGVYGRHKALC